MTAAGTPEPEQKPSFADALTAAARGSGLGKVAPGETPSARALLSAIGGVRGLVESILPGLGFLVVYTLTGELLPSVLAPLGVAVVFVVIRLASRQPVTTALAGVLGVALSAGLALLTGRAEDNFVPGFFINIAWLIALVASLVVRWPLIGVIANLIAGQGPSSWRADRAKVRVATIATLLWIALFGLRLAVQVPLYFAGQVDWLAGTRLLMGVPLYAGVLWVTWLLERSVYARPERE